MKKLCYLFVLILSAHLFSGCKARLRDTKTVADSLNKASSKTITNGTATDIHDAKFTTAAAMEGMFAVGSAKLALIKSTDPEIKKAAGKMIKYFTRWDNKLIHIAQNRNITLPADLDADHQKKMDNLIQANAVDFDKAYTITTTDACKTTLNLLQHESKNGKDAALKEFATKNAPVVQMHLNMISNIYAQKN